MTRLIMLFVTVAAFAGCGGDATESSPQNGTNSTSSNGGPSDAQPGGFETPQAAFAALQKAAVDNDFVAAIRCMSPQSQEMLAEMTTLPLVFMALDPDKSESIQKLLKKHGVSLQDEEFPIKTAEGRIAYISDVMTWLDENADSTEDAPIQKLVNASLGEVTIEGDEAHAAVTDADNQTEDMEFIRLNGKWFVHLGKEIELTQMEPGDFESFDNSGFGGFDEEEPAAPWETVTKEQFDAAWQVTLDVQDQPAGEQLAKLCEDAGLKLEVDPDIEAALQKNVSFQVSAGSRLEAIEAIAQQLDLTPVYSAEFVRFESGKRQYPVVFAGPFLIAVTNLETNPGTATGLLSMQATASDLPPTVLGLMEEMFGDPIDLTAVVDKDGNDLIRHLGSDQMFSAPKSSFEREMTVGLMNLLRRVETLSTLEGTVSLVLPTKVETVKFDELKPGTQKKAGDVSIQLKEVDGGSFTFEYEGVESDDIQLLAFDANGERVESFGRSSFGGGGGGEMSEDFQDPIPVRFEARIVTAKEPLDYEFSLSDIPVPNHLEMPEKLAELKIEGDSPLTLKFDSIGGEENFRKLKFQVTNHTNKDAEAISLTLFYLDADGKELDNDPTTYTDETIPAGKTVNIEVSAYFMPANAKSAKATVQSIEFTDATLWSPE